MTPSVALYICSLSLSSVFSPKARDEMLVDALRKAKFDPRVSTLDIRVKPSYWHSCSQAQKFSNRWTSKVIEREMGHAPVNVIFTCPVECEPGVRTESFSK
jgi:hypothetical protein